jgi:flagellar biosynthesis protein FliQ
MALGARPCDVLWLVLLATGRVLVVGLSVGLSISIFSSRLLADKIQDMGTPGPLLFLLVPAVLILATAVACFLPARTATLIQPMEALRHE